MSKRAYKPTQLKVIEGNLGKRPLPTNEPKPAPITPLISNDIDPEARKIWETLGPKLERMGLLTEIDGDNFSILCQIRSRIANIHNTINITKQLGLGVMDKTVKDLMSLERHYYELFRKFSGEFGLSPRQRVGLAVVGHEKSDGEDLLT